MVLLKQKISSFEKQTPISTVSQLPTFVPNDEYVRLLISLEKEKHKKEDKKDLIKIKNIRKRLTNIEKGLTSEEIIGNWRAAFDITKIDKQ